jgi:hypothetical protein
MGEPARVIDLRDMPARPVDVDAVIELINEGQFDQHIEDLLAALHGRKRERRGHRRPYGRAR